MISREQFCKIIKRLRDYNDLQDKINELFRENIDNQEMDFMNAGSICVGHETIVVDLLKHIFNDKYDYLGWWLYDNDYGSTVSIDDIQDENDKNIDLTTPEKLYDYLIKEMEG